MNTMPKCPLRLFIQGYLNLMNPIAILCSLFLLLLGGILYFFSPLWVLILGLGLFILFYQMISRSRFKFNLKHLRYKKGEIRVFDENSRKWHSDVDIREFSKENLPVADPNNPGYFEFTGIKVSLNSGDKKGVHIVFLPGMRDFRDEVYAFLKQHFPDKCPSD